MNCYIVAGRLPQLRGTDKANIKGQYQKTGEIAQSRYSLRVLLRGCW
jgi:hypothetical protein